MKNLPCILFVLLVSIPTMTQTMTSSPDRTSTQDSAKFSAMEDQFVKEFLASSPVNASQAGYHKHVDSKSGKTILLDAHLDAGMVELARMAEKLGLSTATRIHAGTTLAQPRAAVYAVVEGVWGSPPIVRAARRSR